MGKKAIVLLLLTGIIIFTASCGKVAKQHADMSSSGEKGGTTQEINDVLGMNNTERKIIISASYEIETQNLEETAESFMNQVASLDGYVEKSVRNASSAEFIFRIPASELNTFLTFTKNSGNVTYASQTGKDVTIEYHDTQSELNALKIQEERLLALLEKAETLDNILKLEEELNKIRTSIEKLNTRINELNNLIDYAKVEVSLNKVRTFTEKDNSFTGLIKRSFNSSMNFLQNLIKYTSAVIVWLSPYLLFTAIVMFIILFIRKKRKNKG